MSPPGPPPNAAEVVAHVDEALQGLEVGPDEASAILNFANRELPYLQTPDTSYLVLGSYRDPFHRRLRIVQNELDKRLGTYPFLVGDSEEMDVDRLPTFRIRFYLLAAYANYVVAVFEQDAGGEVTELGKISETPYFDKSHVLPRDYAWMTDRELDTRGAALAAAVTVSHDDDLDAEAVEEELETIAAAARRNGVDLTREELVDRVEDREDAAATAYSWVHRNEFRLFELHGRCHPWSDEDDLRAAVGEVP